MPSPYLPFIIPENIIFAWATCADLNNPQDNQVSKPYRGPSAAATCLAHSPPEAGLPILFAGSVDNGIYAWLTPSGAPHLNFRSGHTGAVTALVTTPIHSPDSTAPSSILISSGLDGRIIIWATGTGEKLFSLGPGGGLDESILSLAIPPRSPDDKSPLILYTSGIKSPIRRFLISTFTDASPNIEEIWPDHPIRVHTAAVEVIHFDLYGELYTASLDGDVTRLNHEQNWTLEQRIHTGGRTRSVAVDNPDGWIITVGGDEEVRVWDRALHQQEGGNLRQLYSGHYGEVMGAVVLDEMALAVTVSLDGTVRRWSVDLNSEVDESVEQGKDQRVGLCVGELRKGERGVVGTGIETGIEMGWSSEEGKE